MKIVVYAISKNEAKFVDRWYNSMKEADEIYVLDTGSTDETVSKLNKLGVIIKTEIINPWRFDVARNKSLDMVPDDVDICVCTDLDEILDKGWRKKLEEKALLANRVRYTNIWAFDKYGNPSVTFLQEKIHSRKGYKWVNAVHEVLKYEGENEKIVTIDDIILKHYPDHNKSRSSYLPLLELAVKEDPENDRNMHYLGREYMYYRKYQESIDTLKKHLELKSATWKDERCASMRFISRDYLNLGNIDEALKYAINSIAEAPYLREGYYETANIYYLQKKYDYAVHYLELALLIKQNPKSYINDPACYNGTIEDILSVCYYYLKDYNTSLKYVNIALNLDPENERIINNKELILKALD